jgi:hypothetical protein
MRLVGRGGFAAPCPSVRDRPAGPQPGVRAPELDSHD